MRGRRLPVDEHDRDERADGECGDPDGPEVWPCRRQDDGWLRECVVVGVDGGERCLQVMPDERPYEEAGSG